MIKSRIGFEVMTNGLRDALSFCGGMTIGVIS
jgi:hypothetical protein